MKWFRSLVDRPERELTAEEALERYDRESGYRRRLGRWKWVVTFIAVSFSLFHLYTAYRGAYEARIQGPIHLGTALGLIFLLYPAKRGWQRKQKGVPWYDVILAFLGLGVGYYNVIFYEQLVTERIVFGYHTLDVVVATVGVLLVLEAARRCVGVPLVVVSIIAILYALFGSYIPTKLLAHSGFSWKTVATDLYLTTKGIFSTPIQVSSTFIFLFILFGVVLTKTGVGQFFNDLAFALTGRLTGGQGKAAVVASLLEGMVSGSSVANTVGSGAFTIPMMKRAGYRPEFAAATEASASTGGQIMPPIMGAAAFIMAMYTDTPYRLVMIAAIIPALLYFTGVFFGIHFESKKYGIVGLPKEQLPGIKKVLLERGYLLLPVVVIIYTLVSGRTPMRAAFLSIIVAFLVGFIRKETRLTPRKLVETLEEGAKTALPVIAACASAGIIVGVVVQTGLGSRLANSVIELGAGNLTLTLFFTMVACLILGMGLPTTANYIVTATIAAPALILGFDIPVLAAHMFVFYFGIVADITPPVCLAAYAGAGLAGANPFRTGLLATRLAAAAYIIPYVFVFSPDLLFIGPRPVTLIITVITAILGMVALSGALSGYFARHTKRWEQLVLFIAGILLIFPNIIASSTGIMLLGTVLFSQWQRPKDSGHPMEATLN